jgi:hypothetical protein
MSLEAALAVSKDAGATAMQEATIGRVQRRPWIGMRILAVQRLEKRSGEEGWR